MNVGIVSARYAEALLKYVEETGNGETVYRQVCGLEKCFSSLEDMRSLIYHPKATSDRLKLRVLATALGGEENAAPELMRFFRLVIRHKRTKFLHLILRIFMEKYRNSRGISWARLVTAVPSEELEKKIAGVLHNVTGRTLELETKNDPSLIGGFIFDMEWTRLDASVASQLNSIKRQFIEKNRRIV